MPYASPRELGAALKEVIDAASKPNPSRADIAARLNRIASEVTATINDPAYETHQNWQDDMKSLYRNLDRIKEARNSLEGASVGLDRLIDEWKHTNPKLAEELAPVLLTVRRAEIAMEQVPQDVSRSIRKFHGRD